MLDVASNYPNKYSSRLCQLCRDEKSLDSQEHLLHCPKLGSDNQVMKKMEYRNIFGDDIEKQIEVAKVLKEHLRMINEMLKREMISSSAEEPSEPVIVIVTSVLQ